LKLVFYYPCEFAHAHATIHGPMGLTYIAAHLKKELGVEDVQIEVDIDSVLAHKPDLVGVSSYTQTYPKALAGAWRIKKELGVPVMLGGPHMNAMPENLPLGGPFDVGAYGEGEHTAVELVRRFITDRWEPQSFGDIPGVVFYDHENQQVKTPKAVEIEDLDSLCYPRRELLEAYFPPQGKVGQWRQGLYTSRDCPFRCRFCIHSTIQGMPRYHSVERVISELEQIVRDYPQQKIVTIYDDIFVVSKKRLIELVDGIRSAGIHKRLGFVAMIKPSTFNQEICLLLKDMNVKLISFGFETGSAGVLKYLKGRGARLSQHQESLDICRNLNIRTTGYFIMGSPIESHEDLAKTYWFIRHNIHELHTAGMFCLIPFPGTRFWDDYKQLTGKTPDHMGWEVFDHKFMDWDEGYPFFINQHYTPEFLKSAYNEFTKLRPRLASAPNWEREEERIMGYKKALYKYVSPLIGETTHLLEIAPYANSYYEWGLYDLLPTALYALNNPDRALPTEPVEALYFNHCLEAQPDPVTFLKQILSQVNVTGPIYLSFYNALFLPVLERLLSGQTPDIFEPPYWQSQHKLFSFPQILKLAKEVGLELKDVYRNPQPLDANREFSRLVPPLLEQLAHPELAREFNIYSYFLVLEKIKN
jgi:anaerobic magnesium-protoporphyrin IX monomethyl ester cyclase